nr:aminoglycoside phosphotransferase [Streptomyces sp.]
MGPVTGVDRVSGGNVSHVFRVTGKHGGVILKVRGRRFARIPALRTDPALIADERRALEVYGERVHSVFPRVLDFHAGAHAMIMTDVFPDRRTYQDHLLERPATPEELERLGRTLRRVHEATRDVRVPIRSQGDVWFRDHTFDFCLRSTPHPTLTRACEELRALDGQQLILGDLCPKNISLAAGGVALCDLDNVHHGWPLYDVGYLLAHVLIHHVDLPARRLGGLADSLLDAYAGEEVIAEADEELMSKVVAGVILYRLAGRLVPYELAVSDGRRGTLRDRVVGLLDHGTFGVEDLVRTTGSLAARATRPTGPGASEEHTASVTALRELGYHVPDIPAIARDQSAFAVRVPTRRLSPAPGVRYEARSVELGDGCFTNVFTLRCALDRVTAEVVSAVEGFHLRDLLGPDGALAAVSGSFSFISDDPAYQPAEPCLDFCCRAGETVSLPTAAKPAFVVHRGRPALLVLPAEGRIRVGGTVFPWVGSKAAGHANRSRRTTALTVFGAANCRVEYADHHRTGFVRLVQRHRNVTPADSSALDCVVSHRPGQGHVITSVHPGGGADLFAGGFVLRADAAYAAGFREGTPVRVVSVGGLAAADLSCGMSLGPSLADAAAGDVSGYDASLGVSPFRDQRYARTVVWLSGQELGFRVFDGAPLTETFRGVTPAETARLCAADGIPPHEAHHLDGGQSSKIGFLQNGAVTVRGSMHYLQWPQDDGADFRWRGLDGRNLKSCFVVRARHR